MNRDDVALPASLLGEWVSAERATEIQMILIEQIALVNPRARGRVKFKQIVYNIANIGLKKPIVESTDLRAVPAEPAPESQPEPSE